MYIINEAFIDYRDFESEIKADSSLNSNKVIKITPMTKDLQKAFQNDNVTTAHTIGFNHKNVYLPNVSRYFSEESHFNCYAYVNSSKAKGQQYLYLDLFIDRRPLKQAMHSTALLKLNYGVYAIILRENINDTIIEKAIEGSK